MARFFGRIRYRTHLPWLVVTGIFGIAMGLGLFTFQYAKGFSYFSDDPQACMNCHVMRDQFEAWRHSTHGRVATCNDCHTPHESPEKWVIKALNGFNHSAAFTLGNFHEPIRITGLNERVVQQSCVGCHATTVSMINSAHFDETVNCITCHSGVGHRTRD